MYRSSVPYNSRSAGYSTAGTRRLADDYTRGTKPLSSLVFSSLNSSRYASQPISTTLSSTLPSASSSASDVISSVASVPETLSTQEGASSRYFGVSHKFRRTLQLPVGSIILCELAALML